MTLRVNRRRFLHATAAASAGMLACSRLSAAPEDQASDRKKALIGRPNRQTLESFKASGFDGIEANVWNITPEEAKEYRREADALGMRIHSVLRGWTNFNSPDLQQVKADAASVEKALITSQVYGADALLLVPCRLLDKVVIPRPEEFSITLDDTTGHVTQVVEGDNAPYAEYVAAHNQAIDASRRVLEKLIPIAEKTGVVIALENVWSNLWVKPELFAHFVNAFRSPWIQSYFDIGNHVKYAPPEEWIKCLGKTIAKIHVKDFVIDRSSARGGQFVNIREGDVNWPSVMRQLDRIDYQGWFTIEGSGKLSVEERSQRLDQILKGQ